MSKSIGNVVDPRSVIEVIPALYQHHCMLDYYVSHPFIFFMLEISCDIHQKKDGAVSIAAQPPQRSQ